MRDFVVYEREFESFFHFVARAGTNGLQGGDAGHGGTAIVEFKNDGGTFTFTRYSDNWIRITASGDAEIESIVQVLQWMVNTLSEEIEIRKH